MKKLLLPLVTILFTFNAFAQKKVTLTIKHMLGSTPFAFGTTSTNSLGQSFNITRVDYYISQITIIHDGGKTTSVPNKYILATGSANVNEELGTFSVTNVEGIKFHIGVEAPTNNGDPSLWPSTHPLAPKSPSMHWGWSAGYRFIALEGKAGPSVSTTYEMHGLGNANYFQQTVMVAGVNIGSNVTINLDADYKEAVFGINVASGPIDHGANATDLELIKNFRDRVFKPGSGLPTSIKNVEQDANLSIYPNPSNGVFQIKFANSNSSITTAKIIDLTGKEIMEIDLKNISSTELKIDTKGFYLLKLYSGNENITTQKIIVE
ncbi:MAG: T9SS type A sorting domain-containing protein [Phycisphaerales bacterium]|nr:T9SS type A sorting domain-containing protein [Phycisphaerales bacterium]